MQVHTYTFRVGAYPRQMHGSLLSTILRGQAVFSRRVVFAILSGRYDADTTHWTFATAGMILGFWLRP
jgi:hypothetical protein